MSEKTKETASKIAFCGSKLLTGVSAVVLGAAVVSAANLYAGMSPEKAEGIAAGLYATSTLLSAVAMYMNKKRDGNKLRRFQNFLLGVSFCGAAAIKGADIPNMEPDRRQIKTQRILSTPPRPEKDTSNTINWSDCVVENPKNLPMIISEIASLSKCASKYSGQGGQASKSNDLGLFFKSAQNMGYKI